jgi:P-type Ca2+ transporter type 2C
MGLTTPPSMDTAVGVWRDGLSSAEARERLVAEGYNELPRERRKSMLAIALSVLREPMLLLLVAAGVLYVFLGDLREALVLLASISVVIGITLYQERKTERALDALRDLASPRALVIRDGQSQRIAGRDVVRGDLVLLAEGDRVPADAVVREGVSLAADESLLTGESVPVRKVAWAGAGMPPPSRPGGDDLPFVYSGTLVTGGQGLAEVLVTGPRTEIGAIGKALHTVAPEQTPLQREVGRLAKWLALAAFGLCALVIIAYVLLRHDLVAGILAGITLAMAMIPEEFPVVLAIFLALGAWRIAQRRVLTRRMPAVEALGSATVLCVDKTGTLTLNRMAVSRLYTHGTVFDVSAQPEHPLPLAHQEIVRDAILASPVEAFDPMERALLELGRRVFSEPVTDGLRLVREYPLTPRLLAVTRVWSRPPTTSHGAHERELLVAAKGAPEAIARLCRMDEADWHETQARVSAMARDGLRVLGVARATLPPGIAGQAGADDAAALPADPTGYRFELVGLIGLADPVRPSVPDAIRECASAGVRVIMITGDYPETARAIARRIGLPRPDECITGSELETLSDDALRERIRETAVFARVVPAQKLRLVQALQANGEVVAMTGDGVNDAPALKAAHIGIAMGGRGTDVAREAASLVLLDDDFAAIVQAIRLGRRIFDNLRDAIAYLLAVHVPIAGMSLIPILLGAPLVLLPVHIVLLEFVIDPASSIAFEAEPEAADVMRRPPRDPREPSLGRRLIGPSLLQGASVLAIVFAVYFLDLRLYANPGEARALAFTTLVLANLALIFANRSWTRIIPATLRTPNPALWWVTGGALAVLALTLTVPFLRDLFQFAPLHPIDLAICLAGALLSITWFELFKLVRSRHAGMRDERAAMP